MLLKIATIISENNVNLKEINLKDGSVSSKRIDTIAFVDENLDLLLYDDVDDLTSLTQTLEKELKFYPIAPLQSAQIDKDTFNELNAEELLAIYEKVSARWILNNNIKTIEQLYPTISYLKDLWIKDRNTFFEELWFILKTNLASTDLNIIFHDLKEPTEKQVEKGEKPKLCYSYVKGQKVPNLFEGKDKEALLMKEYDAEFCQFFNITEYSKEKKQFIACAKIDLSPVLIMARINNFNQLQQSILISLFTGLQDS
ncbi:MAG: hypothetical protein ACJAS4_000814 [Bacteriovoracaceae bacterium]|jgi:hypothetical protein